MFKFNKVFEKNEVRQKLRDKISPDSKFLKKIAG